MHLPSNPFLKHVHCPCHLYIVRCSTVTVKRLTPLQYATHCTEGINSLLPLVERHKSDHNLTRLIHNFSRKLRATFFRIILCKRQTIEKLSCNKNVTYFTRGTKVSRKKTHLAIFDLIHMASKWYKTWKVYMSVKQKLFLLWLRTAFSRRPVSHRLTTVYSLLHVLQTWQCTLFTAYHAL